MTSRLSYKNGIFFFRAHAEKRKLAADAGLHWNRELQCFTTSVVKAAVRLRKYADESAKVILAKHLIVTSPWVGPLPTPKGLKLKKFQKDKGIPWVLSRNKSYLFSDPGTGKTIMAAVSANALRAAVVYLCPPFLTRNVEAEFRKWTTYAKTITRVEPKELTQAGKGSVIIVPDSIINRPEARRLISRFTKAAKERGRETVLFVDEAHRYKELTSQRSKALFGGKITRSIRGKGGEKSTSSTENATGIRKYFDREVYMSGSMMPNRPKELFPILSNVAPETIDFRDFFSYARRYCAAYQDDSTGYWDFDGESHLEELKARTRENFVCRITKAEALPELPPVTEEFVFLGEAPAKVTKLEAKLLRDYSAEDLMKSQLNPNLATMRRELGALKVKPSAEYLKYLLEESDEVLLVFAYHIDVVDGLAEKLKKYEPLVIRGGISNEKRREIELEFQKNKKRRLIIANYLAGGIGITLTRATVVAMVEWSYVPEENKQARDRVHRIGLEHPMRQQYLVFTNSFDRKLMEINFRKNKVIAKI